MGSFIFRFAVASIFFISSPANIWWADENKLTEREKAEGWKLLFDGRTLSGWDATGNKDGWAVEDGAIVCLAKKGGYLYTLDQFDNFMLSIEFKMDEGVNSGIFFRWSDLKDPVNTGIEMQILDSYGKEKPDKHDCGAIYDIMAPSKNAVKPAGQWNRAVITCDDNLIAIELNGQKIIQMDLNKWTTPGMNPDGTRNKFKYAYKDLPRKGHIGLQDHGGRVWFRNIKIRPLKAAKGAAG